MWTRNKCEWLSCLGTRSRHELGMGYESFGCADRRSGIVSRKTRPIQYEKCAAMVGIVSEKRPDFNWAWPRWFAPSRFALSHLQRDDFTMTTEAERRRLYRDTQRPRCCAQLNVPFPAQCSRRASVERAGKFYCGLHDPRRSRTSKTPRKKS